jgi:hypothetical protein
VAIRPIARGEPILVSRISERAVLSANLVPNMRAVTVPVDPVTGVAGFVTPGDVVDVLLTRQIPGDGATSDDNMTSVIMESIQVLAVDRYARALYLLDGTGIEVRQEDLERGRWSFSAERFAAVVCTHYLFRPRLDLLTALLAPGGLWIHETFALGNAHYGRPSNPAFLLRPGELLRAAERAGLHVLAYEDGYTGAPRPARIQRIVAVRAPFDPEALPLGDADGSAAAIESAFSRQAVQP